MNEARYEPCTLSEVATFAAYSASLSSPIDSFLEDHILESQFHLVMIDGHVTGAFAVHKSGLLTHFHMVGAARRHAQSVFADILRQFDVQSAFVPTCDEFFLSHALDDYTAVKKQACFFVDGETDRTPSAASPRADYRLAQPSDIPCIKTNSGDFVDDPDLSIGKGQVHVGFQNGEMVAIGIVIRSVLFERQASIGMFTRESHRKQGIGTSTIRYLKAACRAEGIVPVSGCWYYNQASKKTLEAAGMITATRLLRVEFLQQDANAR